MFARLLLLWAGVAGCIQSQSDTDAHVTAAEGQVSIDRDQQAWAVSSGEQIAAQKVLRTGSDGYARLELADGSYFEVFANSTVGFRLNAGAAGDLIDVVGGRAKIHLQPRAGQPQQRIFTPTAIISASSPATVAIAIDGEDTVRIDVLEGEVQVQHKLLPHATPTTVKAVDAILVEPNEQLSRRLDRGALYRYAIKLRGLINIFTSGHSVRSGQPVEQNQLLASRY